jgi:hypothetical protein
MDTSLSVNIHKKIILLCGIKKGWRARIPASSFLYPSTAATLGRKLLNMPDFPTKAAIGETTEEKKDRGRHLNLERNKFVYIHFIIRRPCEVKAHVGSTKPPLEKIQS